MEMNNLGDSLVREARKMCASFFATTNIQKKCKIFSLFCNFKDIYFKNAEIQSCYQLMLNYINKNKRIFDKAYEDERKSLDKYIKINVPFFEEILPTYNSPNVFLENYHFMNINLYNVFYILDSFFQKIGQKSYDFYHKLLEEKKIICRSPYYTGVMCGMNYNEVDGVAFLSSLRGGNGYAVINKFETLYDLVCLVHEIGHVYSFHVINYGLKDFDSHEELLLLEIPSRLLELLFILYLIELGIYEGKILLQIFINTSKYERFNSDLTKRYKYGIGDMFALSYFDLIPNTISFEDFIKDVYEGSFEEVVCETSDYYRNKKKYLSLF